MPSTENRGGLPYFRRPLFVGIVYCVLSALWIFLSDKLMELLHLDSQAITQWSILKGFAYVLVSGGLIYVVLRRLQHATQNLETTVTARTAELEERQRVSQRQANVLKTLIECAPVGLAFFDREMRYVEVSKRWCEDYGLDFATIIGKSHYSVFPNLPEHWKEAHRKGLAGEVLRSEREPFTDSNGKEHWVRWEVRPWGEVGTGVGGIIILAEEISEHYLLERQLLQAQKMEAVGELAGGVAHDFNNLLMVIRTSAELLKRDAFNPVKVMGHSDRVLEASGRAVSVTRQLLTFSRKHPQVLAFVDPNSVLTGFCKMLRSLVGEDIELLIKAEASGIVHVDPSQFEQVIMNLVVNARDAMPHGGRLVIETADRKIDQEASRQHGAQVPPGDYFVMSVSDTGCGIDEKIRERIFEPFFTTKPAGKGTGLGLSTVYGIVKQSRGFVWVYSEVGRGTTFRVYLPKAVAEAAPAPSPRASRSRVTGTATVLLVEDQPALREVMHDYLQARGFKILPAEDGKAALQLAQAHEDPIHILLTDVIMPGMRGTDLARKFIEIHPEARVMCMSGYSGYVLEDDMLSGATFVQKPIDLDALAAKIRDVLSLH